MVSTLRPLTCAAAYVVLGTQWGLAASFIEIDYQLTAVGGIRWQYAYRVTNVSFAQPITEFTVWFDQNTHRNLSFETPYPLAGDWDELVVQPDLLLHTDGFYDALKLIGGLAAGEEASGFTVAFDWLGAGTPGPQQFETIDPVTFSTLYSGVTTPEPAAAILFLVGLVVAAPRCHRHATR